MHSGNTKRTATCSCRGVELVLAGEPRRVYACSCMECQLCTGTALSVSVGCLEDPEFPPPTMLHWPHRKHKWLCLEGVPEAAAS
ncbi:MAG: hypothetical protein E5V16_01880 [Mesorhizobium sp.]|nr:MAG: hypothetical protein EOS62_09145 [Mesorhizobium sp.]TIU23711.1 MAG: hypothetical protein E5W49_02990 [Mesorhizobium sp.]TIY12002.1 MAG: hypothetical protein E5V16_01880 [Mesorhizobium sp.]